MAETTFLGPKRAEYDPAVRGDPITAERYFAPEWAKAEWDRLWTKVWHIGGWAAELEEAGDWMRHDLGHESVVMVRQEDGAIRAFYNACRHRGNRLALTETGGGPALTCSYHGWRYAPDGALIHAQDAEDVMGGDPCGRVRLVELHCETWNGFVWFSMDPNAAPLHEWLQPVTGMFDNYRMADWTRVMHLTSEVRCNWKVIRDNFNESYHLPTLHPELATFINDDYTDTIFEMFPGGHNRMVMKGSEATGRRPHHFDGAVPAPLDAMVAAWGVDPAAFAGRGRDLRAAVAEAKRRLGPERGFAHYARMTDSELVDYYHYTLFPNVSLTMSADGFQLLRTEPHPTDPERCVFDHWYMMPPVAGMDEVDTPIGRLPFRPAERQRIAHGAGTLGAVADQDLSVSESQQLGLRSRGYTGGLLTGQEKRVQRFHEMLNDLLGMGS
jgi:phenylpropionate dioxygenase-like ring-hydroxylating dioxygenase large terminal subunit